VGRDFKEKILIWSFGECCTGNKCRDRDYKAKRGKNDV